MSLLEMFQTILPMFSLRGMESVFIMKLFSIAICNIFEKSSQHHHNTIYFLKQINHWEKFGAKISWYHSRFWWSKIFEIISRNHHCDSSFIRNSEESVILKIRFDVFLYIENVFLEHITRGIFSVNIAFNVQPKSS